MVDITSIVISVVSLVGALLAAGLAAFQFYSDERKRLSEAEKLVAKYRDPLLLAAQDLQSRMFNIVELRLLEFMRGSKEQQDILVLYTSFLVGQYLSWTYILRRQAQFLCFSTDKDNKELARVLDRIREVISNDQYGSEGMPLMLYRGQQMALGEIMTVSEGSELFCIGYAAFTEKWLNDKIFQGWFESIVTGVTVLAEARFPNASTTPDYRLVIPDYRLRLLQHLLLDLIQILDPKQLRSDMYRSKRCKSAQGCACSHCLVDDSQHEMYTSSIP